MADPKGVVGVLLAPDGRVIANASWFKPDTPGGFTLLEAQRLHCKRSLAMAVVDALAAERLRNVIDAYEAERLMAALCEKGKCKMVLLPIGHEEDGNG